MCLVLCTKVFRSGIGVRKCFVSCICCYCTFDKSSVVGAGWCWCWWHQWWPEGRSRALPEFLPPTPRKLTHSASRKVIAGHHVNIINITADVPPAILPIFLAYWWELWRLFQIIRMKGPQAAGLAVLVLSSCVLQGFSLPQNRWVASKLFYPDRKMNGFPSISFVLDVKGKKKNAAGTQLRSMQGSSVPPLPRTTWQTPSTTRSRWRRKREACSTPSPRSLWSLPPSLLTLSLDPPDPARLTGWSTFLVADFGLFTVSLRNQFL